MSNTMKKFVISALLFSLIGGGAYAQKKASAHGYPIDPVPFTSVKLTDSFWGQRLKASRLLANVKKPDVTRTLKWQLIRVKIIR